MLESILGKLMEADIKEQRRIEDHHLRRERLGKLLFLRVDVDPNTQRAGRDNDGFVFGNRADLDRKRYMESRREMRTLLFGRHERSAASSCARLAGIDSFWRRVAAFACPVITQLRDEYMDFTEYLTPDPDLGLAARIGEKRVGLAGLRVVSLELGECGDREAELLVRGVTLVSQHCADLRALRVHSSGGGMIFGPIGLAVDKILHRCSKLRILSLVDCDDYVPEPVAGRTYALTHMHNGCLCHAGHDCVSVPSMGAAGAGLEALRSDTL